jgi:hypothetical protein
VRRFARWKTAALVGLVPVGAFGQATEPLHTRDLDPFVALGGLPSWPSAPVAGAEQRFDWVLVSEVANHYRFTRRGNERIVLDGETWRTSLGLAWRFAEDWSLALELPYYRQSGGWLDDIVDGWHSLFHLPDEGRNERPADQLQYQLEGAQGQALLLDAAASAWGDTSVSVAHRFGPQGTMVLQAGLRLPTGDTAALTGGVETSASVMLLGTVPVTFLQRAAGWYWGAGVLKPSDPGLVGFGTRDLVYLGLFGVGWQARPHWGLKAQLDMHSAFYDSVLDEIGTTSVQAVLGGWWSGASGRVVDFGVTEDLRVGTAPDVALHVSVHW